MMLVSVGNLALSAAGKTKGFWAAKVVSVGESAVVPSWSCCSLRVRNATTAESGASVAEWLVSVDQLVGYCAIS